MNNTAAHDDHHGPEKGLLRWIKTTNHKDIGTLYLWFAFAMLIVGGALAMGIRAELLHPGLQLMDPHFFNQLTTMHGLIMVFGAIMPAVRRLLDGHFMPHSQQRSLQTQLTSLYLQSTY